MSVEGPGAKDLITTGLDSQKPFLPCPVHLGEAMLLFDKCVSHSVMSDSLWPPWAVAHQAPLSMGFPRPESWSGLPYPFPGDLPDPGIKPKSPAWQVDTTTEPSFWLLSRYNYHTASDGSWIKNPPATQETWVWSLVWEDTLEKELAAYCSIFAWEIPRTEDPGGI